MALKRRNTPKPIKPLIKPKFAQERTPAPIKAMTETQGQYIEALTNYLQLVVLGPAGTGKTFIAGSYAADCLMNHKVSRVIITRPNVPAGRSLGFFPGDMMEKVAPWVVPLTSVISDRMGKGAFEIALKRGDIEIVPFEVMRGRSWDNALIILDEAQNTVPAEMKMFLTRVGGNSQVIVNGDVNQTDLKETSGLKTIIVMINKYKNLSDNAAIIEFTIDDIVRSDICAMWVRAFHKEKL